MHDLILTSMFSDNVSALLRRKIFTKECRGRDDRYEWLSRAYEKILRVNITPHPSEKYIPRHFSVAKPKSKP